MANFGRSPFDEDVNGTIIGPVTFPYEFWETEPKWYCTKPCRIARRSFENDEQAIAWFKENYPADFKEGAEMRVFDR
jgi:hypothetical protein